MAEVSIAQVLALPAAAMGFTIWNVLPVSSPVTVSARARWNGQVVSHIRVYMDSQDVYDAAYQDTVSEQFTLPAGVHYMVVTVWDNHGDHTSVARTFFVQ